MPAPNFANRTLFHGDNLDFLRGINSETIDLIATDPPFNKSKDFHATPDSLAAGAKFEDRWAWDRDVHEDWIDQVKDDWPKAWFVIEAARESWGDSMGAFLCWLGVRLMEMRRILKPTGSLYLHIDHTAHAYVKALMDAIFGRHNFKNEIVWGYRGMPSKARRWQQKHDTLLFYTKSGDYRFTVLRNPPTAGSQRTFASAMNRGYNLNRSKKMVTVFDWDKYRAAVAEGTIPSDLQPKEFTGGQPPMMDWWEDIRILGGPKNKERVGYPTQKPLALYERIIRASSSKGEMVLDPFCGCATTPVAAERLGRQWIGMDIWDGAAKIVRQRMEDNRQLLADPDPQIYYSTTPAQRTDENEVAAPFLKLKMQRALEPWQRLRHGQIVECLVEAQATGGLVICAGCGRVLEREFMQLDHIQPRAEGGANDITNRILLCQPCNGRKGADYTLIGLVRRNKKIGWTQNADRARLAQDSARRKPFATAKSLDNPKALRYWVFLA